MSASVRAIRLMEPEDLPREKFAAQGAKACSDADLLAILMGTGNSGESVTELADRILADCAYSLENLQRMSLRQLMSYKGIGQVKALTIKAAAELTQRRLDENFDKRRPIRNSDDMFRYFERTLHLSELSHEEIHAIYLNHAHRVIRHELIGRGGLTEVSADIRLVLRGALMCDATSLALCHNHPSGNAKPSRQDDHLTNQLADACRTMNITLLDHIIVCGSNLYYSYNDEGRI